MGIVCADIFFSKILQNLCTLKKIKALCRIGFNKIVWMKCKYKKKKNTAEMLLADNYSAYLATYKHQTIVQW